ncbi:980_t:CDS:2, partial [Dentiscutata heterogama]
MPEGRAGHLSIIFQSRLYFMGGSRIIPSTNPIKSSIRGYNLSDQVFYLDLLSSFSTNNPRYLDLSDTPAQMMYGSEKVIGGPSKDEIYIFGGVQQNLSLLNQIDHNETITSNQTLMLNELLNTWKTTNEIIDKNGKMYIFGGRAQIDTGSQEFICFNDLYTYDTTLLKWDKINADNVPSPRSHSTATLLPNGQILYIGGVNQSSPGEDAWPLDMREIAIFDTNSLIWSYKYAEYTSIQIQPRAGHTATLTQDNTSIIIIGGTSSNITNDKGQSTDINPSIYLLDMPCLKW